MFLSFVIPVYNSEKYVEQTLFDIFAEIRKLKKYQDIEIIIINDGSTDKSIEIVEHLISENEDINIKLFSQENSGASISRNNGVKKALGKYIWFFDSDDKIAPNVLAEIISKLKSENLDVLELGIRDYFVDEHKIIDGNFDNQPIDEVVNAIQYLEQCNISYSPWAHIIKKEIITENQIYFLEKVIMEDYDFCWRLFEKCNRIMHLGRVAYIYMVRDGSISRTKSISSYRYKLESAIKILGYTNAYFSAITNEDYKEKIQSQISIFKIAILILLLKSPLLKEEKSIYLKKFKLVGFYNLKPFLKMSLNQKIMYYLVNTGLYYRFFNILEFLVKYK